MGDLDAMLDAYMTCALWASSDESREDGGDPMDDNYTPDDIDPGAVEEMRADCTSFLAECEAGGLDTSEVDDEQMGHDLWLTRNGHGVGFWDRDLGRLGEDLSAIARKMGEVWLDVGDDGVIYATS